MTTRHELLVERGREIIRGAPQAYFDLDVEADGPPGIGSLLSVGVVCPWGERRYFELKPTNRPGTPSSRQFCEEHGLQRERLLVQGIDPQTVMINLAQWATDITQRRGKTQAVLVAFPSWYDFGHIEVATQEAGIPNPFGLNGYCTQSLAILLGSGYDWANASRSALPPEVIPPLEFTHHALADALYQQQMHFAMAALLEEQRQK